MPLFPENYLLARGQNFTTPVAKLSCWLLYNPLLPIIVLGVGSFLNRRKHRCHPDS